MAVFAMVTTLCARPLMAFADGDDTYWPEGPQINSPCAVVMEVNTGTVLYEKNSHEKHYPASITKILDTDEHGIGIKNIAETIRKYGGSYVIQNDEREFYFSIMIPLVKSDF